MGLQSLLWLSTLIFVAMTILNSVFGRQTVDVETLQAAICVFLILGLIWVFVYAVVDLASPASFSIIGGPKAVWSDQHRRRSDFARLVVFSFGTLHLQPVGTWPRRASLQACSRALRR